MEVLNGGAGRVELVQTGNEKNLAELGGQTLIQAIVSLTDLPGPLVQQEMHEIIEASGHRSESLTLEQLRVAMLSYLESIQADLGAEPGEPSDEELLAGDDATSIKTPVILE
jgi:hypothetical protein